ncbi:hypothetical protein PENSUB_9170 [Penicillium subrubescens]|uniref:Uncharacterized protein n=1 Tax=Penicillium subrubescens TaxID=1316194 RepID=A0A1Q5TE48_9EURO|nr:hypothetical protein PENSUB_9170 [Penicillium subrubescens]
MANCIWGGGMFALRRADSTKALNYTSNVWNIISALLEISTTEQATDVLRHQTISHAQETVQQHCKFHCSDLNTGPANSRRALLDQALKIFKLDAYHKPEAARAHYKKGNVLKKMGEEAKAEQELDAALDTFNSIVPPEDRVESIDDLDDEDFDHWIMFWSR